MRVEGCLTGGVNLRHWFACSLGVALRFLGGPYGFQIDAPKKLATPHARRRMDGVTEQFLTYGFR